MWTSFLTMFELQTCSRKHAKAESWQLLVWNTEIDGVACMSGDAKFASRGKVL